VTVFLCKLKNIAKTLLFHGYFAIHASGTAELAIRLQKYDFQKRN